MDQAGAVEFAQDRHDAAGAVHVFQMHVQLGRRDLAEIGHLARQPVDIRHGERHLALLRRRQQVQHRVGRAAHGDIQRHRILERARSSRCRAAKRCGSSCSYQRRARSTISQPASTNSFRRSAWVATMLPLPGSARPSASVRQFIELAVNMPEHEPQVGQAERSITSVSASRHRGIGGGDHGGDQVGRAASCRPSPPCRLPSARRRRRWRGCSAASPPSACPA